MEPILTSVFVFSPVVSFLSSPRRLLSLLFIVASIFYNSSKREINHFELLKVTPYCPIENIKKSFKSVAFSLHPDRNLSSTATTDYSTLVEKYKLLVTPEYHYKYNRFADLVSDDEKSLGSLGIVDLLLISILRNLASVLVTSLVLLLNGEDVLRHPSFIYELFLFFLDAFLRLDNETLPLSNVPILKNYTIFQLITFLKEFKILFVYHSLLFVAKDESLSTVFGFSLLKNNVAIINKLDSLTSKFSDVSMQSRTLDDESKHLNEWKKVMDSSHKQVQNYVSLQCLQDYFQEMFEKLSKQRIGWTEETKSHISEICKKTEKSLEKSVHTPFSLLIIFGVVFFYFLN
ncbi:DnaJ domain containing protein [Theileria equi strain WA]|uniref:DnaJ domain containing protein n=1 Tax=Theileria equi strain WA TaxID=1537102 RepID=L0AVD9_THEEQ|nr:DnaJ domain containing protein [Theileria equi strain WA]AFZ79213.1 DnaJ domain containing protein [Theileria equi strain WA]|eukprot:XP_004828879.1 DnaJ domain containing protein [Theileria equi strain WA]